jgi:uncharacterized membrane protein
MAVIATKMNMANVSSAWVQPCPKLSYTRHEKLGPRKFTVYIYAIVTVKDVYISAQLCFEAWAIKKPFLL